VFICMFKHRWAAKESWKNVVGVLESPEKVLEFFISMKVGTLCAACP